MPLTFQKVKKPKEIALVSRLADEIWHEHYASILSRGQIDYMVIEFQSETAIANQIRSGYEYYLMMEEDEPAGYLAVKTEENRLFLSKIYLLKEHRSKGYSRMAFDFMEGLCKARGLVSVWLTVNRFNIDSIAVYKRRGFEIIRTQVSDIGRGYVMDDYVMEKAID